MNNRNSRDKNYDPAALILSVVLVLLILTAPLSWIGSAMGYPLYNLFSEEGVRWFYAHMHERFTTSLLAVVFPVVLICGSLIRSGLGQLLKDICRIKGRRTRITYRQKTALMIAGIFFAVYFIIMLLLVLLPQAVLLSATGHIWPSPFAYGILPVSALGIQITAMIYANLSNHLHGLSETLSVMYWGIQRYAIWIFITLMVAQVIHSIIYIFDLPV